MSRDVRTKTALWAAIPTPFLDSLALDEQGLRSNVRRYIALGLHGVFCNGLMGEVWSLNHDERKRIVEILVDEAEGQLGVSVVISSSSVDETLALGRHAREVGVEHVVLMVPTSGPRSHEQMSEYFRYICGRLDMPVVVFNAATAAGSPLKSATLAELCKLPQIKMLKTTAYAENEALRAARTNGVIVSDPLEEHFLTNYLAHGQSILYADPEPFLYQMPDARPISDYVAQLDRGDIEQAKTGFASLAPLRRVFNRWVMDPLISGHMPNAALKHWCDLLGMAGGAVRAPIRPLSADEKRQLEAELVASGALGRTRP